MNPLVNLAQKETKSRFWKYPVALAAGFLIGSLLLIIFYNVSVLIIL